MGHGLAPVPVAAQETHARIPVVPGLMLVSTLEFPDGDRENLVQVATADSTGVRYAWQLLETRKDGDTVVAQFVRHVRASDLRGAPRLDPVFLPGDREERPGFTAFTISSAAYTELRDRGTVAYSVTSLETTGGVLGAVAQAVGGGAVGRRARLKGTLTRVTPTPVAFPLIVSGRRTTVPALRARGNFTDGQHRREYELWILADSAHPLVLKSVQAGQVLQVVRVNLPVDLPDPVEEPADTAGVAALERDLRTACRIEVPGVYFDFNSARIAPASDATLAALARVLAHHPEWRITVEGHTDSVGTAAANRKLSERRAEAVRDRLARRHGLNTRAWRAVGYGASRPLESNATIEGRARNRRVELARDC